MESPKSPDRLHAWRCACWAALGALVIGVTLPTVLVWWNCGGLPLRRMQKDPPTQTGNVQTWIEVSEDLAILELIATFFCGPGAVILSLVVFALTRRVTRNESSTLQTVILYGMGVGAGLAFSNVPGYFAGEFMHGETSTVGLKLGLLFLVAGASSGAWIAWQAYRAEHAEARFWPRFSLRTLTLAVIAWGALLGVFAPK